ncbi:hypothetical protein SAMN02745121_01652 [Nannocystis exedens]|uniref:Lipoprotein n=1 Tax=Nannocystis exedens TaxID=54 RepID=A0A1I1VCS5_9BACT|nr:hypothetical protein [Nannocystis exedens]PCC72475.1 hypothetical protein NAEX_05555 [Nannocystis exedens]SFD79798.1 hypothetical protein SAMN02745121_01652 [Nannocystis exedens]
MLCRPILAAPLIALAVAACQPDEPASLCPLTGPVRLAAPPDGWAFDPAAEPEVLGVEDGRIAFTYDERDATSHWQIDACGGEPERVEEDAIPYREQLRTLDTPAGEVTYYLDELTQKILVDRDDLPEPQVLAGLPPADYRADYWPDRIVFVRNEKPGTPTGYAAGLGMATYTLYSHDGDPAQPALFLADGVVRSDRHGLDLLALRDDGELRRVDVDTGETTILLTGVRAFSVSSPSLIWQEMGDDVAEPVYLRDLDTGSERPLLINDFCQRSWGRDPDFPGSNYGSWGFDHETGLAGLSGPGYKLAAMHRLADGAALEIPAHDQWEIWDDGIVVFETFEPGETVSFKLWDPVTGAEHVWYRGAFADSPAFLAHDGDGIDYLVFTDRDAWLGSLWRYDFASGRHAEVLPRMSYYHSRLDDGRYIVRFPSSDLDGAVDLVVIDRDTGSYTTLAERAHSPWPLRTDEDQLAYAWLDLLGPEPGLWMTPLPPK